MKRFGGVCVGVLLIGMFAFMAFSDGSAIMAKIPEADTIAIYQDGKALNYVAGNDEKVLLDDVIDYKLTSLDGVTQNIIVLHEERSDDLDSEGYALAQEEGLVLGGYVRIYEVITQKHILALQLVYEKDFTRVNPWALEAGHLDDNNKLDVYVGAYRATDYYEAARRPFVLEWTGDYLTRKWTGSALNTMTFSKVVFEDLEGDGIDELLAYQYNDQLGPVKSYFRWGEFAFDQIKIEALD